MIDDQIYNSKKGAEINVECEGALKKEKGLSLNHLNSEIQKIINNGKI